MNRSSSEQTATRSRGARAAGRVAAWRTAAVACAALALSACAGDDGDGVALPPESGLSEIRALNLGEFNLASRPATCERTHAVLIVAGKPHPRELRLAQGACLVWGNRASDAPVIVRFARRAAGKRDLSSRLPPRFASPVQGPLEALPRREAFKATGGAVSPFSYNSESGTASELAIRAFHPARSRPQALRCPSRALRGPVAKTPLKLSYTIEPGGAKGTLILNRSGRASQPAGLVPRGLEEVARLACGKLTVADLPAGCRTTRPILIAAGQPSPRELKLPRAGGCVVWGNQDGSEATVEFSRSTPPDAPINHRRLWPRATAAWDFFYRSSPAEIPYTIQPGRAKGTIVLD